jgi:hypothetical protein
MTTLRLGKRNAQEQHDGWEDNYFLIVGATQLL